MTSKQNSQKIRVGIGILVFKDKKVLLGKRKSSHGEGEYAGLGGHLEFGESFEDCVRRESREEAGIEVKNIRFLCVSNVRKYNKHYVDIGIIADLASGTPQVLEKDKCEGWEWYELDKFPKPLFAAVEVYKKALKNNKSFFDK